MQDTVQIEYNHATVYIFFSELFLKQMKKDTIPLFTMLCDLYSVLNYILTDIKNATLG